MISHATCTAPTSPVPKELTKMKRKKKENLVTQKTKWSDYFCSLKVEILNFSSSLGRHIGSGSSHNLCLDSLWDIFHLSEHITFHRSTLLM